MEKSFLPFNIHHSAFCIRIESAPLSHPYIPPMKSLWNACARLERLQARLTALGRGDVEPLPLQQDPEHIQDPHLVVDHQNRGLLAHAASSLRRAAGRYTVKVVPRPAVESTRTRPRCASTARCTMASPSPVPPTRPVTNGSNSRARRFSGMPGPLSVT